MVNGINLLKNPFSKLGSSANTLGVSFSPAGLLTPFHVGASTKLQQLGFISDDTPLSGSSGGALAAATTALKIKPEIVLTASVSVASKCRDEGTRGTLMTALISALDDALPENAYRTLNTRKANCTLAYSEIGKNYTSLIPRLVNRFTSQDDLVDTLLASCNIPLYFNGNNLGVPVRGAMAVDGFFAVPFNRFGCPFTGASEREILVSPLSAKLIGLRPELNDPIRKYDIITPDILSPEQWPFNTLEITRMAFGPPASRKAPGRPISTSEIEEIYDQLFYSGICAVETWYKNQGK